MLSFLLFSGLVLAWCLHAPWRRGLALLLVLVVWEGALRKWVMPGASNYLLFLKDAVLVIVALKAWRDMIAVGRSMPAELTALLIVFTAYGCLQIFNPGLPSPLIGIYGIKAYVLYALLAFLVPAAFRTPLEFRAFMRFFLLLAIPALAIAFLQFNAGVDSQLNIAVRDRGYIDTFGGDVAKARSAGTFGYITGLGHFISFVFTWTLVLMTHDEAPRWRRIYLLVTGLTVGAAFTNGGRFSVFFMVLMTVGVTVVGLIKQQHGARFKRARRVIAGAGLAAVAGALIFQGAASAFQDRVAGVNDSILMRVVVNVVEPFELLSLVGRGIGSTHGGAIAFGETLLGTDLQFLMETGAEWLWSRIMIETGLIGTILWLGIILSVLLAAARLAVRLRDSLHATAAAACALYCALNFLSNVPFDHVFAVFYWFVAGSIFAIQRWAREPLYHGFSRPPMLQRLEPAPAAGPRRAPLRRGRYPKNSGH